MKKDSKYLIHFNILFTVAIIIIIKNLNSDSFINKELNQKFVI